MAVDGSQFNRLFADGEVFSIGRLQAQAMHVPGHTPADVAYRISDPGGGPDAVFVGDTLFMPDVGTARCDFPGGDAPTLFRSIRRLLTLPLKTVLYLCHDYPRTARQPASPLSHNSALTTSMCATAYSRRYSLRAAKLATPRWLCRR